MSEDVTLLDDRFEPDLDEAPCWAPPSAPMDMPPQMLEAAPRRVDLMAILRLIFPRQRI